MVFTDGQQTKNKGPFTELQIASRDLKQKGVAVYAMGIGKNVERKELKDIASNNDNVFIATSFEALEGFAETLKATLCKGKVMRFITLTDISKLANVIKDYTTQFMSAVLEK